jgi:CRISPR-associated endoribonuclease Cas6
MVQTHPKLTWAEDTELLGLSCRVRPIRDSIAPVNYTVQLHSWFLNQVRLSDPDLSAYLHDSQSEKAFTVSGLVGLTQDQAGSPIFLASEFYQWRVTALSKRVVRWMQHWVQSPPRKLELRLGHFEVVEWSILLPATTYQEIWSAAASHSRELRSSDLSFTFVSPTGFRRKGTHLPLPMPENVFHSYLRRWRDFGISLVDDQDFLTWVESHIVIVRHEIRSQKVQVSKQGSVTGFTGSVQFAIVKRDQSNYVQLIYSLEQFAPYCGTGHKTTFGLGQTRLGWNVAAHYDRQTQANIPPAATQNLQPSDKAITPVKCLKTIDRKTDLHGLIKEAEPLKLAEAEPQRDDLILAPTKTDRLRELTDIFLHSKVRKGGSRATDTAEKWAMIIHKQESGESLKSIALGMDIPYESIKKYAQHARKVLEQLSMEQS